MGFNPFRTHRPQPADLVIVVVTLLVAAAVVLWAATGW